MTIAQADGFWGLLERLAAEPALLELILILFVGALVWLVGLRLGRLAAQSRSRAALADYLLGVEQALAGDLAGARRRLERVLADEPENADARVVYGDVLRQLGEHAEAHKQHLLLQKSFALDSVPNDLAIAQNLLEIGRHAEAAEAAGRIVAGHPDHRAALTLLFEAQLGAGLPLPAAETGTRLLRMLAPGAERDRVRERTAASFALAGRVRAQAGDLAAARALSVKAQALGAPNAELQLLEARLALADHGTSAATQLLLPGPQALVRAEPQQTQPAQPLLLAPFRCATCNAPLPQRVAVCPHCRARGVAELLEPRLFGEIESPALLMDEVDQNLAHARRLVERALTGDLQAEADLTHGGAAAIEAILEAAARGGLEGPAERWLARMGPDSLPALFQACRRAKERQLLPLGRWLRRETRPGLLAAVVQGFGRDALPYVRALANDPDRELRDLVVDFHIGLGEHAEFARLVEEFAPHELLKRLDLAPAELLVPFLAGVEAGSFLADGLLLSPVFHRDEELVAALAAAQPADVIAQVLIRRGPGRNVVRALVDAVATPATADAAHRVLAAFGASALEQEIAAFVDPDFPSASRGHLEELIVQLGAATVEPLCSAFGAHPARSDTDVQRLLSRLGPAAVDPLVLAYQRGSLLERIGLPLVARRTHRREMILRALTALGGEAARDALQRLRGRETDDSLKLRIEQGLARLREQAAQERGTA